MSPITHFHCDKPVATKQALVASASIRVAAAGKAHTAEKISAGSASIAPVAARGTRTILQVSSSRTKWEQSDEKRFSRLVGLDALGKATEAELKELDELTSERRRLHLARSGEEVLRDYQESQKIQKLVTALREYVELWPSH